MALGVVVGVPISLPCLSFLGAGRLVFAFLSPPPGLESLNLPCAMFVRLWEPKILKISLPKKVPKMPRGKKRRPANACAKQREEAGREADRNHKYLLEALAQDDADDNINALHQIDTILSRCRANTQIEAADAVVRAVLPHLGTAAHARVSPVAWGCLRNAALGIEALRSATVAREVPQLAVAQLAASLARGDAALAANQELATAQLGLLLSACEDPASGYAPADDAVAALCGLAGCAVDTIATVALEVLLVAHDEDVVLKPATLDAIHRLGQSAFDLAAPLSSAARRRRQVLAFALTLRVCELDTATRVASAEAVQAAAGRVAAAAASPSLQLASQAALELARFASDDDADLDCRCLALEALSDALAAGGDLQQFGHGVRHKLPAHVLLLGGEQHLGRGILAGLPDAVTAARRGDARRAPSDAAVSLVSRYLQCAGVAVAGCADGELERTPAIWEALLVTTSKLDAAVGDDVQTGVLQLVAAFAERVEAARIVPDVAQQQRLCSEWMRLHKLVTFRVQPAALSLAGSLLALCGAALASDGGPWTAVSETLVDSLSAASADAAIEAAAALVQAGVRLSAVHAALMQLLQRIELLGADRADFLGQVLIALAHDLTSLGYDCTMLKSFEARVSGKKRTASEVSASAHGASSPSDDESDESDDGDEA